jgi:tmRNA-binding protein
MKNIIQTALNNGFSFTSMFYEGSVENGLVIKSWSVCSIFKERIDISYSYRYSDSDKTWVSIHDLLANESFCKSIFGEGESGRRYLNHCKKLSVIFDLKEKISYIENNIII